MYKVSIFKNIVYGNGRQMKIITKSYFWGKNVSSQNFDCVKSRMSYFVRVSVIYFIS